MWQRAARVAVKALPVITTGIYPEQKKIDPYSFSHGATVSIGDRGTIQLAQGKNVILLTPREVRLLAAMINPK